MAPDYSLVVVLKRVSFPKWMERWKTGEAQNRPFSAG
jgi:hypothetical protein